MLGGRWLFSLILVGFIIYAFSYSIRVKGRFRDIIDNECSDDQSAEVYQELIKGIDESVIPLNTSILVMFFIVFLIDCSVMWHH
jgi:hypothetical protein